MRPLVCCRALVEGTVTVERSCNEHDCRIFLHKKNNGGISFLLIFVLGTVNGNRVCGKRAVEGDRRENWRGKDSIRSGQHHSIRLAEVPGLDHGVRCERIPEEVPGGVRLYQ